MEPNAGQLASAFAAEAGRELTNAVGKIKHCLDQLTDAEVWWRPSESMNSVANLVLHLCGNVRQWIISGVGGVPDTRDRPKEFSERGNTPKAELLRLLEATVAEARQAINRASPAELLRVRTIQSFEGTGLGAVLHSVTHFWGHTQEIIHLTRTRKGDAYQFAWVPKTKEQGAPI